MKFRASFFELVFIIVKFKEYATRFWFESSHKAPFLTGF